MLLPYSVFGKLREGEWEFIVEFVGGLDMGN
jgi:hypothetical protein